MQLAVYFHTDMNMTFHSCVSECPGIFAHYYIDCWFVVKFIHGRFIHSQNSCPCSANQGSCRANKRIRCTDNRTCGWWHQKASRTFSISHLVTSNDQNPAVLKQKPHDKFLLARLPYWTIVSPLKILREKSVLQDRSIIISFYWARSNMRVSWTLSDFCIMHQPSTFIWQFSITRFYEMRQSVI